MNLEWWLALVKEGGQYCAVLEFGALVWLANDRARILVRLEEKSAKVEALATQVITVATELRMYLFNERKA